MNCKTGSTMKKILSAALSLTVAVSASAVTLPSLISAGSIVVGAAAADVSINSTSVELYAMDDWANEYISIPSTYQTRFQLKVTGASDVTYSSNSQYVTVSDKGLIETKYALTYWYNQGGWSVGYGYPLEGQTPSRITKNINFSPATITVTADNRTFRVNVTLKDYVDVYVEKVLDDYVKSSIKPTMTTYEKCVKIAEFIAARNYDPHYASTAGLVVSGGADCWGSTETAIRLAEKAGLRSWVRNGNRDALAGSGHKNAIVYDGKEIYIIEAGYGGTAPRYWEVEKRNTFWSYRTASSGDGIELYQYDDETMPEVLTVPSSVDGKEVVGLGYNFISMSRNVKQVVLPNTLKYIGTNAFYGCSSLEKINFPAGLERIDERAFGECYSLKTVTSASSAFKYVGSVIYNGTTAISCPHGENVNLRSGTKVVGTGAFAYNSKLQSVTLPSSVETLEEGAFSQCYNFSSLKINSTKLKSIGSYALAYNKLTYILLPDSVTTISPHAFDTYSGNNADMLLVGKAGGAVETYAKDNGHSFLDSAKAVKNTSTVSAATVNVGSNVSVKVTCSGGKAPYTLEGSYRYQTDAALSENKLTSNLNSFSFKAEKSGCYVVSTVVTDGYGIRQEKTFNITVKNVLTNTSAISNKIISKGGTTTITGKATGGKGGYTYALQQKKADGTYTTIRDFSTDPVMTFKGTTVGTVNLRTVVKDSAGNLAYKSFNVKVNPAPLVISASISSGETIVNRALLVQATAGGGSGNYQFALDYKLNGSTAYTNLIPFSSNAYMVFNPTFAGDYIVRAGVKDAAGKTAYQTFNVTVKDAVTVKVTTPSVVYAGKTYKIRAAASGGFGTYTYRFNYKLDTDSTWTGSKTYTETSVLSFTPAVTGTYQIRVYARDCKKHSVNQTITIKVDVTKLTNACKMKAASVTAGKTATVNAGATGGKAPYKYSVSVMFPGENTWKSIYTNSTNTSLSFSTTSKGTYSVRTTVKDASGQTSNKTIKFTAT